MGIKDVKITLHVWAIFPLHFFQESMKGCDPKFLRNLRYIKAGTRRVMKEKKAKAKK